MGMGTKIMVTGVGGPAGVAVLRALASGDEYRTLGVDCDPQAVGLRIADEGALVPRATDENFGSELVALAMRTGTELIVCTVAEEMGALHGVVGRLADAGIRTWLPRTDSVETCIDKWRFAEFLREAQLPGPATGLGSADGIPGPWIVKPRFGRGSRDVVAVDDDDELVWALRRVPDPVVQTRVPGMEFTVDVLVDRDSTLLAAVPRWRSETKAGISTRGTTFCDQAVTDVTHRLIAALRFEGVANVQGFLAPSGEVQLIEMNPRFSGGLPLSLAAGSDLTGQYVRIAMGLPVERSRLNFEPGVSMFRHFVEIFE